MPIEPLAKRFEAASGKFIRWMFGSTPAMEGDGLVVELGRVIPEMGVHLLMCFDGIQERIDT